jgi:hypothetical protein
MHREDNGDLLGYFGQACHGVAEERSVDPVPVKRDDQVSAALQPVRLRRPSRLDSRPHGDEGVDHRVADVVDPGLVDTLGDQIVPALRRVDEEQPGELVGHDPIDLLRETAVEAPQARLDVTHGQHELRGCQRRGRRRVHVARDEHYVRLRLQQHRLEPLHHAGRLLCVRPGPDTERVVRLAHAELLEEDLGHLPVVVLTCVHQDVLELVRAPGQLRGDRRDLHHVRPRADDRQDLAPIGHTSRIKSRPALLVRR